MAERNNKKLLMAYVYMVLKEFSDEQHPMKQQDIIDRIQTLYDMPCERKAVAANLQCLEELGACICKVPNVGVYLGERTFEPSEVTFLVDAVFSCKSISSAHSRELAEKLFSEFSIHQRKKYNYIFKADQIVRSDNRQTFYVIELLGEAIEKKRKVTFHYIGYDVQGQVRRPTEVSPYYLVNSNGKYYLVCHNPRHGRVSNYRIDRISDVCITEKPIVPVEEAAGGHFDIAEYTNNNVYMFGMGPVTAELTIRNSTAITYIHDWFGKNAAVFNRDGRIIARITADEQALVYWCLQYGDFVELMSPASTRKKIKTMLQSLTDLYRD